MKTRHQILLGDATNMHQIPDNSIDLIVTSPPYFGQRVYFDNKGNPITEAVGSEAAPGEYLDALDRFMEEAWRVIKPTGSVFVNLGDKYAGSGGHNNDRIQGTKYDAETPTRDGPTHYVKVSETRRKSLLGLPWRFALRQMDAGWILRQEIIWSKSNGMPESATDRTKRFHEQWFHLVKEENYFSSIDALRQPIKPQSVERDKQGYPGGAFTSQFQGSPLDKREQSSTKTFGHPLGTLPSSVQTISTGGVRPTKEEQRKFNLPKHFAPFPPEWPRFFILGWSPEGGLVLDPFAGTGTTSLVAQILNRSSIALDISPAYIRLMNWRIRISDHRAKLERKWKKKGLL